MDLDFCWRAVFVELPYSAAVLSQAEKRLHRITTTRPPLVTYLYAKGKGAEIDARIVDILYKKADTFKEVVGSEMASAGLLSET